jgi:UDP-N-acetylmuramoyl-tripeptide--D-alanyl-D-alanine ligase
VLDLADLVSLWGPPQRGDGAAPNLQQRLGPVCTDSRLLTSDTFFVPLRGERFDGHHFLANATEQGVQAAVVARDSDIPVPPDLLHWTVDDTLEAYQQIACLVRRNLSSAVVAVTGSAGKTTTRELIRAALAPLGDIQASIGNNNNDVGVPLTLLGVGEHHAAVVVEMGMRGPGEIERLSRCAEPEIAVITNVGTAHIGRLGSREAIAAAKCEITAALSPDGLVVVSAGDQLLEAALARCWSGRVRRVALVSDHNNSDQTADDVGDYNTATGMIQVGEHSYHCPLEGRHNARNFMLALAVANSLGVSPSNLKQLDVEVPGGRNRRRQIGALTILDETYNASPEAVFAALDLLAAQPGRRFAVLGTMLELGADSVRLHKAVVDHAATLNLDGLVAVAKGAEAKAMSEASATWPRFRQVETPEQAAEPLIEWLKPGDSVLLKASRGIALERLLPLLPQL